MTTQKKYGNISLAKKKLTEIMGSTYYHHESHPKIHIFASFLLLGRRKFSTEVLHFYLTSLEKIMQSKVGINIAPDDKSDIDVVPYLKAIDGIRLMFEDKIPTDAYARLRNDIDRITVITNR